MHRLWLLLLPSMALADVNPSIRLQNHGSNLPFRFKLNFSGTGVSCTDNPSSARVDCTVAGAGALIADAPFVGSGTSDSHLTCPTCVTSFQTAYSHGGAGPQLITLDAVRQALALDIAGVALTYRTTDQTLVNQTANAGGMAFAIIDSNTTELAGSSLPKLYFGVNAQGQLRGQSYNSESQKFFFVPNADTHLQIAESTLIEGGDLWLEPGKGANYNNGGWLAGYGGSLHLISGLVGDNVPSNNSSYRSGFIELDTPSAITGVLRAGQGLASNGLSDVTVGNGYANRVEIGRTGQADAISGNDGTYVNGSKIYLRLPTTGAWHLQQNAVDRLLLDASGNFTLALPTAATALFQAGTGGFSLQRSGADRVKITGTDALQLSSGASASVAMTYGSLGFTIIGPSGANPFVVSDADRTYINTSQSGTGVAVYAGQLASTLTTDDGVIVEANHYTGFRVSAGNRATILSTTYQSTGNTDLGPTDGDPGVRLNVEGTTKSGHYAAGGSAPTATVGNASQLGISPACVITAGKDAAGTITVTAGTAPAAFVGGTAITACTVNFNVAYASAPVSVIVTPANTNAAAASSGATAVICFADQASTTTANFLLKCVDSGAGSLTGSTAYAFAYHVTQ